MVNDPRYVKALSQLPQELVDRFSDEVDAVIINHRPPIVPALLAEADRARAEGWPTAAAWEEFARAQVDGDLAELEEP